MTTSAGRPTWGDGVRACRGIKGFTQVELAEKARVTQTTISRIESGSRQISDSVRVRIAKVLEVDPHELFPYIDDEAQVSA